MQGWDQRDVGEGGVGGQKEMGRAGDNKQEKEELCRAGWVIASHRLSCSPSLWKLEER